MHRGSRKIWCCMTHITGTWNMRSTTQYEFDTLKQGMENFIIEKLDMIELKWAGTGHFQSVKYRAFYHRSYKVKRNKVALILRQDIDTLYQFGAIIQCQTKWHWVGKNYQSSSMLQLQILEKNQNIFIKVFRRKMIMHQNKIRWPRDTRMQK